jgi:hypothetical protein
MKQCPDCATKNQRTNIFCPTCGHSFLDEEPPERKRKGGARDIIPGEDNRRLFIIIAVVVVVVLGLAAGLTSYLVSREIDRSSLVMVKSGVRFKCVKCGKLYKDRVANLAVKKSKKEDYGVENVEGLCDACKYGALAGSFQDALEYMSKKGYFHGFAIDIAEPAAQFLSANPALFPAADPASAAAISATVDPTVIGRSFNQYAGKPVAMEGKVLATQTVQVPGGAKLAYLQFQPVGEKGPLNVEYLIIYNGSQQVTAGQTLTAYMVPTDVVTYRSKQGDKKAVLNVAMALVPEKAPAGN